VPDQISRRNAVCLEAIWTWIIIALFPEGRPSFSLSQNSRSCEHTSHSTRLTSCSWVAKTRIVYRSRLAGKCCGDDSVVKVCGTDPSVDIFDVFTR
jgi:hypothetical protein